MMEEQIIEISPLAFMRGRTFKDAWIVADEMQNATPAQVKMLLTRIGENSKIVVTGDVEQADKHGSNNGLLDLCDRLAQQNVNGMAINQFTGRDIQRHPIIDSVLTLYKD
jgi:phosphate starvation-inducible PhoH-like protein